MRILDYYLIPEVLILTFEYIINDIINDITNDIINDIINYVVF